MRKFTIVFLKCLLFIAIWIVSLIIPIQRLSNAALFRFLLEAVPLAGVTVSTIILLYIDKNKVSIKLFSHPMRNVIVGLLAGTLWIAISIGALFFLGSAEITQTESVSQLYIWIIAMFLNAAMQELLIRGYIFFLLCKMYNTIAAAIFTVALFVLMHPAWLDGEWLVTVNLALASLVFTSSLLCTESLIAPILMHGLWNTIGAIGFKIVSVASDYPHLYNVKLNGNAVITGSSAMLEGSIIVTVTNILVVVVFIILINNKRHKYSSARNYLCNYLH